MMGLFSNSSPYDADVEKATDVKNTTEDWALIMDICDSVGNSSQNAKDCLRSIVKRLNAADPHIVILAITLLDACASNCGKTFHLEIASRDFEGELRKLIQRSHQKIVEMLKGLLKKWAEGDFKTDPQLNLIPSLYNKLKSEGIDFSTVTETVSRQPKHMVSHGRDSAAAAPSQEEEDIAKAIELSLKENKQQHNSSSSHSSPSSKKTSSLYPSVNSSLAAGGAGAEGRKVRALYDFEAAEDNELSFFAGDIIHILDDSDPNWWKGTKNKAEGLFPSNFVTADLSVEPDQFIKLENGSKKSVQFSEEVEVKTVKREPEIIEVEIDEAKIDRLLHLLHEADPQSDANDPPEMLELEEQVTAMGPLIDAALEKVDRRHAQLTQLSSDLVDALNLYHTLMRDPPHTPQNYALPKMPAHMYSYPNQGQPAPMYNGMPAHPQPGYGAAPGPPGHYNPMPGMPPPNDYMPGGPANMPSMPNMPQHYHMQTGPHQHPQAGLPPGHHPQAHPQPHPQGPPPQVNDQGGLVYPQPQPFPSQGVPAPSQYVHPGPMSGVVPINQQQQQQQHYAPANGQHMM